MRDWWSGLGRLRRAEGGAVIVLFALALPFLCGFAGLGFDYVRATLIQQRLHQAADAAALAAVGLNGSEAEREAMAAKVFAANYGGGWLAPASVPVVTFDANGKVRVSVGTSFAPTFLTGMGMGSVEVAATGEARRAAANLEIALVVDVTGSMGYDAGGGQTRMEALKAAAHRFVDTIMAAKPPSVTFKLAIVPFNIAVNVGTSSTAFVEGRFHALFAGTAWRGCVLERRGGDAFSDAYDPVSTGTDGKWRAYVAPPEPNLPPNAWGFCINPSNGGNGGYAAVIEPGPSDGNILKNGPNNNCTKQVIMPLTDDVAAMRARITALALETSVGTNAGPGISWGMRALSPTEPFTEGSAYDRDTRKIIVLMTDGKQQAIGAPDCKNSQNSGTAYTFTPSNLGLDGAPLGPKGPDENFTAYGYVMASNPFGSAAAGVEGRYNEIVLRACDAAKAQGAAQGAPVEVFTVAFSDDIAAGDAAETTLKACATNPSTHYFHALSGSELDDTFQKIVKSLFKIRLAG